jgi:hypothetical protein
MPHSTSRYRFEWKVLDWASRLSTALTGHPHYPFLVLFTPDGQLRQIHLGDAPERHDDAVWQRLRAAAPAWLAYDPFEGPEYTYLQWQDVPKATFERLLGATFTTEDLTAADQGIEFPATWGVMF